MNTTLNTLLIICPLVFMAGFVDSIAGGGGLIALPSYLLAGFPMHFALGTNKFSSSIGTLFSTARFIKNSKIHYKSAIWSAVSAILGSFAGARLALALDEKYLKYFMVAFLPLVAVFVLTRKGFGEKDTAHHMPDRKLIILSILSGLVVGAYDGFFGPGTGTFLILMYTGVIGFNLTTASGNAKIVNFSSNIAAVIIFVTGGKVNYLVGLPAAVFAILGHWIGSGLAIRNGAKVIKPVFIAVLALLFFKIVYDIFQ